MGNPLLSSGTVRPGVMVAVNGPILVCCNRIIHPLHYPFVFAWIEVIIIVMLTTGNTDVVKLIHSCFRLVDIINILYHIKVIIVWIKLMAQSVSLTLASAHTSRCTKFTRSLYIAQNIQNSTCAYHWH